MITSKTKTLVFLVLALLILDKVQCAPSIKAYPTSPVYAVYGQPFYLVLSGYSYFHTVSSWSYGGQPSWMGV